MYQRKVMKIFAHRGASIEAVENTLPAIETAIAIGASAVEIDVHLSKDGVPVVFHDDDLKRLTGNPARINDLTLEELKAIPIRGSRIPTLEEVLDCVRERCGLMIEIKHSHEKSSDPTSAVLDAIRRHPGQIYLGSYTPKCLELAQERFPHIPRIAIMDEVKDAKDFWHINPSIIALDYTRYTPEFSKELREKGVEAWAFTVDDAKTLGELLEIGVNTIITNNPRAFVSN